MTPQELREIEERCENATNVPRLLAEVKRLRGVIAKRNYPFRVPIE